MKKLVARALVVSAVLAFAVTVAASEGPRVRPSGGESGGPIACWVKGTMCRNPSECCHHSCSDDGTSFHHKRCD